MQIKEGMMRKAYDLTIESFLSKETKEDRLVCAIMDLVDPEIFNIALADEVENAKTVDMAFEKFHKAFRQYDNFGNPHKDMFFWHLIRFSKKYNKALYETIKKITGTENG